MTKDEHKMPTTVRELVAKIVVQKMGERVLRDPMLASNPMSLITASVEETVAVFDMMAKEVSNAFELGPDGAVRKKS